MSLYCNIFDAESLIAKINYPVASTIPSYVSALSDQHVLYSYTLARRAFYWWRKQSPFFQTENAECRTLDVQFLKMLIGERALRFPKGYNFKLYSLCEEYLEGRRSGAISRVTLDLTWYPTGIVNVARVQYLRDYPYSTWYKKRTPPWRVKYD